MRSTTYSSIARAGSGADGHAYGHATPVVELEPIRGERPWAAFRRLRSAGRGPAVAQGFGFRLGFAAPVAGPIAVGYGAHFGLGLFRPER